MDPKTTRSITLAAVILSGLGMALCIGPILSKAAESIYSPLDVVFSEVAWAGMPTSPHDEWIELANNTDLNIDLTGWRLYTDDGTPDLVLSGIIPGGGSFLLERTDDTSVPDRTKDLLYTGGLSNEPGEIITLTDHAGQVIDIVGLDGGNHWYAGSDFPECHTLVRVDLFAPGSLLSSWGEGPSGGNPVNSILYQDLDSFGFSPNFDWLGGSGVDFETRDEDCDDQNSSVHPGAEEVLNDIDDDCDGQIDEFLVPLDWVAHFNTSVAMWAMNKSVGESAMETALFTHIQEAETSIDAALYGFNLSRVAQALITAQGRGVQVRLVGDDEEVTGNYSPTYNTVIAAGIPVVTDVSTYLEHNKFAVFDELTIWTGSTNWTETGMTYNANNAMVITSTNLAQAYTTEFDEMFSGSFHNSKTDNTIHDFDYSDGSVSVYFSPTDGAQEAILDVISNAQQSIHFSMFFWTTDTIADLVLTKAITEGLTVSGVWDAVGAANEYSQDDVLCAAGIPIKVEIFGGKVHHKYAVIDVHGANPMVITGSYNWTGSAEDHNDENLIIISQTAVAQSYYQDFQQLYNNLPAGTICSTHSAESGLAACSDGDDNDYDGYIDGDDWDCDESTEPACRDGLDNDGDGDFDLDDLDCYMVTIWNRVYLPIVLH